jgi:muramidase (phage lysozyme)
MDKSIPTGAAILLDFIGSIEAPKGYTTIYGNNQTKLAKPITSMTLDEVETAQRSWTKRFGSSAAGRYQFMRLTLDAPGTIADIEGEMKLTGREIFSPDLQDRMAFHLLKRRGYLDFKRGKLTLIGFGKRLAQEWASFPVLIATQGAHRRIGRGETYYAGDRLNKALVPPEKIETILAKVAAAAA